MEVRFLQTMTRSDRKAARLASASRVFMKAYVDHPYDLTGQVEVSKNISE